MTTTPSYDVKSSLSLPPIQAKTSAAWVLFVAIVGSSMTFIDSSAVNVALPSIARDLRADAASVQWVIEGYALFLAALILLGGSLGDLFGRRRIFVIGIALFALASLACAGAHTIGVLNGARCLQGLGGALATPGSLALISANTSGSARGKAIGLWSGFASITGAIGPVLGGWLAQHASWRYVFLINVPLALLVVIAALVRVPESRDEAGPHELDIIGAGLATTALGALTFGLLSMENGLRDTRGLASVACSIVLGAAFFAWERRARAPMIPLNIFANRVFTGANAYTFLLYAALGGSLFFVPFDLQNVHGYSPTAAGAAMLPFILIMFGLSRWSGGLVATLGARIPLVAGAILAGLGFLAYARVGVTGSFVTTFLPATILLGLGGALFVAPLTTTVMEAIASSHAGVASGINNAVARTASLLAIAALGIVLAATLFADFDRRSAAIVLTQQTRQTLVLDRALLGTALAPAALREPDRTRVETALRLAYTLGFQRVMILSAIFAWLAAVIAAMTIPGRLGARTDVGAVP